MGESRTRDLSITSPTRCTSAEPWRRVVVVVVVIYGSGSGAMKEMFYFRRTTLNRQAASAADADAGGRLAPAGHRHHATSAARKLISCPHPPSVLRFSQGRIDEFPSRNAFFIPSPASLPFPSPLSLFYWPSILDVLTSVARPSISSFPLFSTLLDNHIWLPSFSPSCFFYPFLSSNVARRSGGALVDVVKKFPVKSKLQASYWRIFVPNPVYRLLTSRDYYIISGAKDFIFIIRLAISRKLLLISYKSPRKPAISPLCVRPIHPQ